MSSTAGQPEPTKSTPVKAGSSAAGEGATSNNNVALKTADEQLFYVEEEVATQFLTVRTFIYENQSIDKSDPIPLPNVASKALSDIIACCRKQLAISKTVSEEEKKQKEKEYETDSDNPKNKTNDELKEMILAANYLHIRDLLGELNQIVADRIKNKSVEYVRDFFGIDNDFSEEEEQRLRQENPWAYEGVDQD